MKGKFRFINKIMMKHRKLLLISIGFILDCYLYFRCAQRVQLIENAAHRMITCGVLHDLFILIRVRGSF